MEEDKDFIICNQSKRKTRTLTYKGETHTITGWADKTGQSRDKITKKIKKYDAGMIDLDEVLDPDTKKRPEQLPASGLIKHKLGPRAEALNLWYEEVAAWARRDLKTEFETLKMTGERGPLLKFYKDHKEFLLTDKGPDSLDSGNKPVATVAVIIQQEPYRNDDFTVIDM